MGPSYLRWDDDAASSGVVDDGMMLRELQRGADDYSDTLARRLDNDREHQQREVMETKIHAGP